MNPDEEQSLVDYVRRAAEAHLSSSEPEAPPSCAGGITCGGLFVTFRRQGQLRGCMGRFVDPCSVADLLADVTQSALHDPRFVTSPLTVGELRDTNIEISILGPRYDVARPEQLIAGVHGVVITREDRTGCFLPQVARERGWSIETFLSECCRQKAGLPADAWRDPETRVQAFEATILHDRRATSPAAPPDSRPKDTPER